MLTSRLQLNVLCRELLICVVEYFNSKIFFQVDSSFE